MKNLIFFVCTLLFKDGFTWFLIRESATGSFNSSNPGYMMYREDFVKLKMMSYMIHKSAVKGLK